MIPKFTVGKNDKLFISEKWLCNGVWLCSREIANSHVGPKALKPLLSLQHGCYHEGIACGKTADTDRLPDFAAIIPKRDGYLLSAIDAVGVDIRPDTDEVKAYKFQVVGPKDAGGIETGFIFGVAPQFVPLLRLGHAFAKGPRDPVIVLDSNDLNGNLLAIVMPYRLN